MSTPSDSLFRVFFNYLNSCLLFSFCQAQSPPDPSKVSLEGRKPLVLLPRSKPIGETGGAAASAPADEEEKKSSIFGTGKPRDVNRPEIRELEERLEHTLAVSSRDQPEPRARTDSNTSSIKSGASSAAKK